MNLKESASLVVDLHLGGSVSSDTLIQGALSPWLFENRIQKLIAHTPEVSSSHDTHAVHRTPKAIINHLTQRFDPTEGKVHTEHLLKWYQGGHFRQEDHEHIRGLLKRYEKNKTVLPFKPQEFDHPAGLSDAMDDHLGVTHISDFAKSMSPQDRDAVERGSELVHNDENFEIRKLRSKAHHLNPEEAAEVDYESRRAMQILGDNTSWCTTPKDSTMFERYSKKGPLYWIHDKKNNRRNVFLESDAQFVDEKNKNRYSDFEKSGKLEPRFKPIEHLLHKFNFTDDKKRAADTNLPAEDVLKIIDNHDSFGVREAARQNFLHKNRVVTDDFLHHHLVDSPHPNAQTSSTIAERLIAKAQEEANKKDSNVKDSFFDSKPYKTIHAALTTHRNQHAAVRRMLASSNLPLHPNTCRHLLIDHLDPDLHVRRSTASKSSKDENLVRDLLSSKSGWDKEEILSSPGSIMRGLLGSQHQSAFRFDTLRAGALNSSLTPLSKSVIGQHMSTYGLEEGKKEGKIKGFIKDAVAHGSFDRELLKDLIKNHTEDVEPEIARNLILDKSGGNTGIHPDLKLSYDLVNHLMDNHSSVDSDTIHGLLKDPKFYQSGTSDFDRLRHALSHPLTTEEGIKHVLANTKNYYEPQIKGTFPVDIRKEAVRKLQNGKLLSDLITDDGEPSSIKKEAARNPNLKWSDRVRLLKDKYPENAPAEPRPEFKIGTKEFKNASSKEAEDHYRLMELLTGRSEEPSFYPVNKHNSELLDYLHNHPNVPKRTKRFIQSAKNNSKSQPWRTGITT